MSTQMAVRPAAAHERTDPRPRAQGLNGAASSILRPEGKVKFVETAPDLRPDVTFPLLQSVSRHHPPPSATACPSTTSTPAVPAAGAGVHTTEPSAASLRRLAGPHLGSGTLGMTPLHARPLAVQGSPQGMALITGWVGHDSCGAKVSYLEDGR